MFTSSEPEVSFKKLNYFKDDYSAISKCLGEAAFNELDLSQSLAYFTDKIVEVWEKYMPVSKESNGRNKNTHMSQDLDWKISRASTPNG